jgi:hypothetical protein
MSVGARLCGTGRMTTATAGGTGGLIRLGVLLWLT